MDLLFVSYECGLIIFGRPTEGNHGSVNLENPISIDIDKVNPGSVSLK